MSRTGWWAAAVLIGAAGCSSPEPVPPAPAPAVRASFVSATFDLTWNAAIDHFAAMSMQLAVVDRASGRLVTDRITVTPPEASEAADCGARGLQEREPYLADSVVYSVVVEDEGRSSTVAVTASWSTSDPRATFSCETKGVLEPEMQEAIRLAAEANR